MQTRWISVFHKVAARPAVDSLECSTELAQCNGLGLTSAKRTKGSMKSIWDFNFDAILFGYHWKSGPG